MKKRDWKLKRNWLAKEVREQGLTKQKAFKSRVKYQRLTKADIKKLKDQRDD